MDADSAARILDLAEPRGSRSTAVAGFALILALAAHGALVGGFPEVAEHAAMSPATARTSPMESEHMKRLMAIGAAATISAGASGQDAVQWRVEDGGNGHWYQVFPRVSGRDWTGWQRHATTTGGHLATLTSPAESDFVSSKQVFQLPPPDCIGAHALIGAYQPSGSAEPSVGWTWVTGEPFVMDASQWGSLEDCCNGSYCDGDGEDASALWCWIGDCENPQVAGKWNDVGK
ncbi:MAG: hypothetical protein ACO3QC_12605, partial [Phycisphaerales bacterium]